MAMGLSVDDYLNGSFAGPILAPALGGGTSPMTVAGAGNQPAQAAPRAMYASSNTAIVLAWTILLVILVLSHTFTFSLQE